LTRSTPPSPNGDNLGRATAITADGSSILLGAPGASAIGVVDVYDRTSSGYVQSAELQSSDGEQGDQFGDALALSSDGNVALIGAVYKPGIICNQGQCQGNSGPGAAYVFTRSGSVWDQTAGLAAYDGSDVSQFGNADALSGDGSVALIGSETHNNGAGAAYVFGPTGTPAATSVRLTAGTNPSTYGDSLTFTAHLGPVSNPEPTGSVQFWTGPPSDHGSRELGSAQAANYQASLTTTGVPVDNHGVYAVYEGSPSFAGSQNSVQQVVRPFPTTITAGDESVASGSPLPTLLWNASPLANGDTADTITTPPTCSSTVSVDAQRNVTSPPGSYPITCSGAGDDNYTFSYVGGTLTVT
jgi:hypothetical protein